MDPNQSQGEPTNTPQPSVDLPNSPSSVVTPPVMSQQQNPVQPQPRQHPQPDSSPQSPADLIGDDNFGLPTNTAAPVATNAVPNTTSRPAQIVGDSLVWQAMEYVQQSKNSNWFIAIVVGAILICTGVVFLYRSNIFAMVSTILMILSMVTAVLVFSRRPPRTMQYQISGGGFTINGKQYSFSQFKAFGILQDDQLNTILLIPVQRIMPAVTLFFTNEQGEAVVDALSDRLPMQEVHETIVDSISRRLQF